MHLTYENGKVKSVQELGEVTDLTYEHWELHMIWSTHHTAIFFKQKKVVSTCVKPQTEDTPTTNMTLNPIKVVWLKLWQSPFPYENICHS